MTSQVWNYVPCIHSFGGDFGVAIGSAIGGSTPASAVFPASNNAIFVPMPLQQSTLITRLYAVNGGTVSGNIDMGIYDDSGTRITSIGSTAQAGTNAPQFFDIGDLVLGPGRYYLAVSMDNITGTLFRSNIAIRHLKMLGVLKMATAFALPATATFATVDATFLPLIGAEVIRVL